MPSKIRFVLLMGVSLMHLCSARVGEAREGYWQGDVSTDWNTAGNWFVVGAPGDGSFVPQSSGGFNVRAIIGTDSPNGVLNTTVGNAPSISAALPAAKQTIGGLYFGLRELDYTVNPPALVNPAPAAGALVGSLTISGGTLNSVSTAEAGFGADGRIVVGADGRGFLTMTGGTLNGPQLVVGGEQFTGDSLGVSMVTMSGASTIAINNAVVANGTAAFDRRLKITGPNAKITTNGAVSFGASSDFTAVITSAANPAAPAMIQSGSAVKLGGSLNVEFSGAGATGHTLGDKWNLFSATTGVGNNFTNLGPGNQVAVAGLASPAPLGSAYYLRTVDGGPGKLVQLAYEGVLVLHIDRDTGELAITNPLGGDIAIDSYQVTSARGSLLASYDGLGSTTPGAGDWVSGANSVNGLFEVKQPDMTPPIDNQDAYDLSSVASVTLGTGFSRTGVGANITNFGNDGEDLVFSYSSPDGGIIRGQIVYEGVKFENDLVLRVNPNTGQATIKNDSLETLHFDGYSIVSSTNALSGASWTGLGGGWAKTPASTSSLTESNLLGETVLAPGAELSIGDISASAFGSQAAKDGLSFQFILSAGVGALDGDFNTDGVVDAADYTVWRDGLGSTYVQSDYDVWTANYGASNGPETTFRTGSVVFDSALAGGASLAIPEPATAMLAGLAVVSLGLVRRGERGLRVSIRRSSIQGETSMPARIHTGTVAAAMLAIALMVQQATAVTQGVPLTNLDFELPGPVGTKTIAFDSTGAPLNNIPGWTFPGPGVEDYGHEDHEDGDALGDSGVEGGGNPGNEMILSTFDGIAYQTSTFNVVSIPATQKYSLTFDAHNIFTIYGDGAPEFEESQTELIARLYYLAIDGTTRTTIGSPLVISGLAGFENYSIEFLGGAPALTPALGRPIGVEFDVTSDVYNPTWVEHSWIGVDNVLLQITGVLPGDLDGDGDVDLSDYAAVRDHQQQSQYYKAQGELTGDGQVNLNDFRAFKALYDAQNGSGSFAAALAVPEPSSLTLGVAMLLGVIFGRFKRSRPSWVVLGALCLTATARPASAELLFYDPFLSGTNAAAGEYLPDALLAGQNPVAPFGSQPDLLSGPWIATATAGGRSKPSPGLNYIGAPAMGGSIGTVPDATTFDNSTRVGRYFKPGSEWTDATTGTFYISWLQNFGTISNVTDDMGFRAFEMWRTTGALGDPNLLGDLGYNAYYSPLGSVQQQAATARLAFQHQIIEGSPVFIEDGATHLLVMKFVLSDQADSDVISIYLDPTSVTEPELPSLAITGTNVQLAAVGMGQFGGGGPTYNTIDELRISTTFIDALPELPLPGDTDGDRDVDLDDYNNIILHLGMQVGTALEGDVAKADGSQGSDGRVTIADYRIWKDNYPTLSASSGSSQSFSNVPEPTSCVLLLIAAPMIVCRRGRRKGGMPEGCSLRR
jgi:hypothetical protein